MRNCGIVNKQNGKERVGYLQDKGNQQGVIV